MAAKRKGKTKPQTDAIVCDLCGAPYLLAQPLNLPGSSTVVWKLSRNV